MRNRRRKNRLYIILLIILSLTIIMTSVYLREGEEGALHSIQREVRDTISAPVAVFKNVYDRFSAWVYGVLNSKQLAEENKLLRRQIRESRKLVLESRDIKRENDLLRKLLGFKERFSFDTVPAEIIIVHQKLSGKLYTINKGSKDGIEEDAPVVTPDGLFGKIYSLGEESSVILPVNHPLSSVSARIVETNEVGILDGSREGKLHLKLIPKETSATIGNVIVTSGLGKVYPKGLYIGTIVSMSDDPNRLDKEIEVGPAVTFDKTEFVLVVKKGTGEQKE